MNNYKGLNNAFLIILITIIPFTANAQTLPKIQTASVRAPDNIKIDGHATEWDNKFQAYNSGTEIFYTISNDDNNLYLIIQATKLQVVRKIIAGSVTFSINAPADKKDKSISITYPVFGSKNRPNINLQNRPIPTKDSSVSSKQVDVFMDAINKQLQEKSKEIKIIGLKDMDTLISVYNETGIKAASLFNHQLAYTIELAVPLKYLGLSFNGLTKFAYNIKLNGSDRAEDVTPPAQIPPGVDWRTYHPPASQGNFMRYPTDLSGSYALAQK